MDKNLLRYCRDFRGEDKNDFTRNEAMFLEKSA